MDARLQLRVQRYGWDRASGHYERGWARQLSPAHDAVLELAGLAAGERVLDVACGTGLVTLPAARSVGPDGLVEATDLSEEMVAIVARLAARDALTQVRTRRAGAEDLGGEDGLFDAVLCSLGLMYVPDPDAAAREMHRVLRVGGRAVAAVWGPRARCGWADIFPIVDSRVSTDVCPLFFALGTDGSLERCFDRAGFAEIRTERITTELAYIDDEEALVAAFEGGPVAMAYDRFDEATRDEARAEYLASIAAYRTGEGYRIPGEFVVVRGEKRA